MTNIYKTDLFPYLEVSMLRGKPTTLTIAEFHTEIVSDFTGKNTPRHIITFEETDKKLILNKTNAKAIAERHGDETDTWHGKQIEVYPDTYRNRAVIRIRGLSEEH